MTNKRATQRCQVAVVGAGPAGCAAGIVLARAGLDVVVLDRATFPRPKVCGDAVSNGGMDLLAELNAVQEVASRPHARVDHASVVFPDGSRLGRDYAQPGMVMERVELDDALRVTLERSGATVLQGTTARKPVMAGRRVVGVEGPGVDLRADIVIAADGPNSFALCAVTGQRPRSGFLAVSSTAYLHGVTFPQGEHTADHYLESELPFGYGWVFPEILGRANVGVYQRSDAYDRGQVTLKQAFSAFLRRHPERFEGATLDGPLRTWSLPLSPAPHALSAPGLLLAGDAAGLVDPLSGEGIWQALFSGIEAAKTARLALAMGGLHRPLRARYAAVLQRRIGMPSRGKRLLQHGLNVTVSGGLYEMAGVRELLRAAYAGGLLEMTKH